MEKKRKFELIFNENMKLSAIGFYTYLSFPSHTFRKAFNKMDLQ